MLSRNAKGGEAFGCECEIKIGLSGCPVGEEERGEVSYLISFLKLIVQTVFDGTFNELLLLMEWLIGLYQQSSPSFMIEMIYLVKMPILV